MPVQKVCEKCGVKFNVSPRRADEVRFCSRECKTASGRVQLSCAACGEVFEKVRSDLRGQKAYCSKTCYTKSQTGRKIAASDARPRYFKVCEVCRNEYRVTQTRKETARFCSRACQGASDAFRKECSDRQQADKHWRWSGGKYLTHEGYIRHKRKVQGVEGFTYNHRQVLTEALVQENPSHPFLIERDGKRLMNPMIDVHHIDRNRSNNDLSNLLAVTKEAHAQIHHRNKKPEPWECWPPNPANW